MSNATFRRPIFNLACNRASEPRKRIQILAGPRQVGKTTLATQLLEALDLPSHYTSADEPTVRDRGWLQAQWEIGRRRASESSQGGLLVLDEVQKVSQWSETVKSLWDEDTRKRVPLKVMLLGSSPLLMEKGLSESLTGRFELIRVPHWSLAEMRAAFSFSVDDFIYFGGYPGAADLIDDRDRWSAYILDSIIETTISRDVLLLTRVDKPALLRGLFRLACEYSGQIVSYQKLTGQLQDAGNTTTLAHYLDLLSSAGMIAGLEKFSGAKWRQRRSSPKLLALNTALVSAISDLERDEAQSDGTHWGRLVETAVGSHIANGADTRADVLYWRERNKEVDFVVKRGRSLTAIEVKSGTRRESVSGLAEFRDAHPSARIHLVGGDGLPVEEFLDFGAGEWIA